MKNGAAPDSNQASGGSFFVGCLQHGPTWLQDANHTTFLLQVQKTTVLVFGSCFILHPFTEPGLKMFKVPAAT